ncbi:serine hydrolase domain-containing protein [Stackebrandtia nassauensis]|uniref:Beta-lactamase n=1 Tax=Stackebrandtia nassauensis (strain DSM 44728 / CIP 108903 / NRRL B-16338 / NBRC 102104 / LLR-40K-21) TaxID=446470 RepID=D3QAY9_STANL|nr:serine hydrolase domain-containing protein [Stackebrandtia nassauensis]ADD44785.1 beta-lactamase [Stackebrandtia nassauensis DSM 44728]
MNTRTRLSRRGLVATTVGAASALAVGGGAWAWATSGHETIDEYLRDNLPDDASLAIVAVRGGKTLYRKGFGLADRKADIRCGHRTVFDIGSVTKQFTGAAILRLDMDGALKVSDPLSRHLPGLPADKRKITLHQLLTHTGGFTDLPDLSDYDEVDRSRLLSEFGDRELKWKPGTRYEYSNLGYSVLAAVIEIVTSGNYEEYLADNLFHPAGMRHTGYLLPDWDPATVAQQYDDKGRVMGKPHELPWDDDGPYWILRGNGGILSTARDMTAWHRALDGDEVLSAKAKRKLFKPHVPEDETGESHYGYGWTISTDEAGRKVVWHDGGNEWSSAMIVRCPEAETMLFLASNAADWGGDMQTLAVDILPLLDA